MITPEQLNLGGLEQQYGLPNGLLSAVMNQESQGDPTAVSPKGAQGVFQFLPATAKQYGIDPLDPQQAAVGAARMYSDLSKKYNGDVPSMLAGYNWGQGNLDKNGLDNAPQETRDYISKISGKLGQPQQVAQAGTQTTITPLSNDTSVPEGFQLDAAPSQQPMALPDGFQLDSPEQPTAWQKRQANTEKFADRSPTGQMSTTGQINSAGNLLGYLGNDLPGQAISGLASLAPQSVKDAGQSALQWLGSTDVGQAAKQAASTVSSAYGDFSEAHPKTANTLGSVANLAQFIPVAKAADVAKGATGSALESVGESVAQSGANSAAAAKSKFAQDLVMPKETPSVVAGQDRVEKGLLRTQEVVPTPYEKSVAQTVSTLPVSKSNSLLGNENIIKDSLGKEASGLIESLKANDVAIPSEVTASALQDTLEKLKKNPFITGDGESAANKVMIGAMEALQNNTQTASGVLQARKDFDRWAEAQKGEKIFGGGLDSPANRAVQEIRRTFNSIVNNAVPDVGVQQSLQRQSHMYSALDNIAAKRAAQPTNRIARAGQKVANAVSLKGAVVGTGAALGGGALAGLGALPLAGAGLAGYGVYKGLTSPALRQGTGAALRTLGKAIK